MKMESVLELAWRWEASPSPATEAWMACWRPWGRMSARLPTPGGPFHNGLMCSEVLANDHAL
jgi:hypothetical protein